MDLWVDHLPFLVCRFLVSKWLVSTGSELLSPWPAWEFQGIWKETWIKNELVISIWQLPGGITKLGIWGKSGFDKRTADYKVSVIEKVALLDGSEIAERKWQITGQYKDFLFLLVKWEIAASFWVTCGTVVVIIYYDKLSLEGHLGLILTYWETLEQEHS